MLRLHQEQNKSSGLKISLTPTAAPARLSIYPCDAYGSDDARPKAVACTQDNLIRQIPRLRESLSALDEEIHSELTKPDHAETMRIHSKILQLQDKRMGEVEGRLNSLAGDSELFEQLHLVSGKHIMDMSEQLSDKNHLFEQLHHVSGRHIMDMSKQLSDKNHLFEQLHHASGKHIMDMSEQLSGLRMAHDASSVERKVQDLTQATAISQDILKNCQERLSDASAASRKAQQAQDAHREMQSELADMRQDMSSVSRKLEAIAQKQSEAVEPRRSVFSAPSTQACDTNELIKEVAKSVIEIKKMVGGQSQDVASLNRKVEHMETKLETSQLHAETYSLLQRDMLSGNRSKKTRS
jgi:methyl-accepting chemotaxis protein